MDRYERLLRPEVVARLKGIDLKARLVVEGFLSGLHRSPYKGFSVEFTEYRPYMPGDELKRLDWKVYAKTDRFYTREYEEETNLKAYLILDGSGSMGYSSNRVSKLEYGSCLAASLAYLLLHQHDSVGLAVVDSKIRSYIPPRLSPSHLHILLDAIAKTEPGKETNLARAFHELAERIRRRGLVLVISDLLDDADEVVRALSHFRSRKHEVLVFQILDPNELRFDFKQPLILKDLETGQELSTDPRVLAREYRLAIKEFIEQLKRRCREGLIDYELITTDTPYDRALFRYLTKRQRLY